MKLGMPAFGNGCIGAGCTGKQHLVQTPHALNLFARNTRREHATCKVEKGRLGQTDRLLDNGDCCNKCDCLLHGIAWNAVKSSCLYLYIYCIMYIYFYLCLYM